MTNKKAAKRSKLSKYELKIKDTFVEMCTFETLDGPPRDGIMFETFGWDGFVENKDIPKLIKFLERSISHE